MSASTKTAAGPEKRVHARKRAAIPGLVCSLDGKISYDCTIRDVSKSGALYSASAVADVGPVFYLINTRDRLAYQCVLTRKRSAMFGVRFNSSLQIGAGLEPSLRFLNGLWIKRATT